MFTKPLLFVAFLLASCSLCVESIKMGGSNPMHVDYSLANFARRNDLTKADEDGCFGEFSDNQSNEVIKLGERRRLCGDNERRDNKIVDEGLTAVAWEIARKQNDICVEIDTDCRDTFAKTGNVSEALLCYELVATKARYPLIEMGEQSKLKLLTAKNERLSIRTANKNCTNIANFNYLAASDLNFDHLITTCDNSESESSTTLSTTQSTSQSPVQTTTPIVEVSTTTEVEEGPSSPGRTEPTTERGRFPWS